MAVERQATVLVTGGSGLVGRAMQDEDADLTDANQTCLLFESHKPDYVINLAAKVGGLYANMTDNESFWQVNTAINTNVLQLSKKFQVKKCISCLSTCIFPAEVEYPLDETKIHLGPPHSSNVGYSMAKRQVDLLNRQLNDHEGSLFTAVIPTNIYGRYDNFNLQHCHVIPGLVHKAYNKVMEAREKSLTEAVLVICGSGKPLRQFIYAPDLAKLILWTLENYTDKDPLILSPDEDCEISISYIADIITDIFNRKFGLNMIVDYDLNQSDGQYKKTASNGKLRKLYPDFKFTSFKTAIQEVIDWFCSNYSIARK